MKRGLPHQEQEPKRKTLLITGANGIIGTVLTQGLQQDYQASPPPRWITHYLGLPTGN